MPDDHASSADRPIVCGADVSGRPDRELAADRHVRVLLPLPLPTALDYLAPDGGAPPEPGSFVRVPLGVAATPRAIGGSVKLARSSGIR